MNRVYIGVSALAKGIWNILNPVAVNQPLCSPQVFLDPARESKS